MGRRGSRTSHSCALRRWSADQYPFADDLARGMADTWCGERKLWDRDKPFPPNRHAECPKCAQALGKVQLAKLSDRLRLEKREQPFSYTKSTYDLWIDGVLRGHVCINNGWGEKWFAAKVEDPGKSSGWTHGRHGGRVSGSVLGRYQAERLQPDAATFWPVHFAARDAMAVAALAYHDKALAKGLPSPLSTLEEQAEQEARRKAQRVQEEEERAVRLEAARVERERNEGIRAERVEAWRLALVDLEARGDLSNLERAGLEAIKLLFPT